MQFLLVFLLFGTLVYSEDVERPFGFSPAYGYMKNIGIPEAERIRKAEEVGLRIVGGVPAAIGQYPFQAGILGDVVQGGQTLTSVCGGSLISASRVLTAAHCWNDGVHQAWRFTIVLGSIHLFSGGTRVQTSAVAMHPSWNAALTRNDIAVAYLASPVSLSATVAPVALPSGSEIFETFIGERAIAIGFGTTSDSGSISTNQVLSHVSVSVINNGDCSLVFPIILQGSNICTSGLGGVGFCRGDSGGPLIVNRGNRQLLIGVASFNSVLGCQSGLPNAYARVTSFMDFINQNL
ncbi:hypothetical protein PYW07_012317 [Mythimna separata]|uniref:Peptidase S1 domain-containing protein n=1 Tax=Mythimna separata TaxID=271217 RepID=A0AAD7YMS0_MYTSE|nr:hypothetical protein PYW07_012317 [Mythimna separata]